MAPSPGVCFLSFCITALCDFFLELAGEWRQWVPDPIDRKRRRLLTRSLNCGGGPLRVWDPLCGFKHSTWVQFHRRPRILLKYQRVTWGQSCRRRAKQRWSGWPLRGCRIGEAGHPGPQPGTPLGGERRARERSPPRPAACIPARTGTPAAVRSARVFCPVAGCPCSDAARARGWASEANMRSHIDAHLAGSLEGDVPQTWLQSRGRIRCPVCGLSVSECHGIHPTCRPEARAAAIDPGDAMEADGLALPSFEEIQSASTSTLRHVPAAVRHLWSQVLTQALAAVAHRNDEAAWRELLMLPQCLLCPPARGGKRHAKAAAAFTRDRIQRWLEGERLSLWASRPSPKRKPHGAPSAAERRDMATSLGREGFDKKACAALLSKGLCPPTAENAQVLEALHPSRPSPAARALQELPVPLVARCLRAFPAETAPGPSGLRAQHLRDACVAGCHDALIVQLTAVLNVMVQGRAPPCVAPVVAGAGLVALTKPNGGLRPIAVGELLRRLAGKCLVNVVREDAGSYFWASWCSREKAVHTVRAWAERRAGSSQKVLVKLDFANAFNSVQRDAVLQQVVDHFPALSRWATWCYRQPTRLQFGDRVLSSSSGVQQGDPLGPLLFAAALQPLARELRSRPLDLAIHFLDDGILAGDLAAVSAALTEVQLRAAEIGLVLNLSKCEVVVFGAVDETTLRAYFPNAVLQNPDGSGKVLRNFEFLGAAIGDAAYIQAHTAARTAKAGVAQSSTLPLLQLRLWPREL